MNCDRIAPFYKLLEGMAFGGRLQSHRLTFLAAASGQQRALILGDGDGRFTQALVNAYPQLEIDSIEISGGMISEAGKHLAGHSRLRVIQADALTFEFPADQYDVVFTHFFLDCFSDDRLNTLVTRISSSLTCKGVWIISEFRQVPGGWQRVYTGLWLAAMYFAFRLATGLKTRRLPHYSRALSAAGFEKARESITMAGLIASEWWQRNDRCAG